MTEREQYEQALLWRGRVLPLLTDAVEVLEQASDCCPISLERVKLRTAIKEAQAALYLCEQNMNTAIARLEQMGNDDD